MGLSSPCGLFLNRPNSVLSDVYKKQMHKLCVNVRFYCKKHRVCVNVRSSQMAVLLLLDPGYTWINTTTVFCESYKIVKQISVILNNINITPLRTVNVYSCQFISICELKWNLFRLIPTYICNISLVIINAQCYQMMSWSQTF